MRLLRIGVGKIFSFVGRKGNPPAAHGTFLVTENFAFDISTEAGDNLVTE